MPVIVYIGLLGVSYNSIIIVFEKHILQGIYIVQYIDLTNKFFMI